MSDIISFMKEQGVDLSLIPTDGNYEQLEIGETAVEMADDPETDPPTDTSDTTPPANEPADTVVEAEGDGEVVDGGADNEPVEDDLSVLREKVLSRKKEMKLPIKWNGVEAEVDVETLINKAQIGINAELTHDKRREEAEMFKFIKSTGLTKEEISALTNLKTNKKEGLAEFIARTGIDLSELKEHIYDVDEEAVTKIANAPVASQPQFNQVDTAINALMEYEPEVFEGLKKSLVEYPGLEAYVTAIHQRNDSSNFDNLTTIVRNGDLEKVKPYFSQALINLPASKKAVLNQDPNVFLEVYNKAALLAEEQEKQVVRQREVVEKKAVIPRAPKTSAPVETSGKPSSKQEKQEKLKEKLYSYIDNPDAFLANAGRGY